LICHILCLSYLHAKINAQEELCLSKTILR
jgi:hypothetical protein